jgi:hypothetical protein
MERIYFSKLISKLKYEKKKHLLQVSMVKMGHTWQNI